MPKKIEYPITRALSVLRREYINARERLTVIVKAIPCMNLQMNSNEVIICTSVIIIKYSLAARYLKNRRSREKKLT
jgi:hypothetical protein